MLLCCLRRNVETSCYTLCRRLSPSTNSTAYRRLVSSTRHFPFQLTVLHLALEPFTARDGARYWLRIAIFAYPICIRRPGGRVPVEILPWRLVRTNYNGVLPDGEKILKICLFVSSECTNVTDRRTPHGGIGHACITSRDKNRQLAVPCNGTRSVFRCAWCQFLPLFGKVTCR